MGWLHLPGDDPLAAILRTFEFQDVTIPEPQLPRDGCIIKHTTSECNIDSLQVLFSRAPFRIDDCVQHLLFVPHSFYSSKVWSSMMSSSRGLGVCAITFASITIVGESLDSDLSRVKKQHSLLDAFRASTACMSTVTSEPAQLQHYSLGLMLEW